MRNNPLNSFENAAPYGAAFIVGDSRSFTDAYYYDQFKSSK